MKIEELVNWSAPETVQTRAGEKTIRKATPTPEFWDIYKANKDALKQAGVSLSKYRDQWELAWWNSTITTENIEHKKELIEKSKAIEATIDIPCNPGISYLPYQRGGIQFLSERENVLLGDEMGLGKTIQVIGYMNLVRPKKTLIIVPASLKLNWKRELEKWLVYPASIQVIGAKDPYRNKDITIVNYDILNRYQFTHTWDLVALDEGHYIKNMGAARTKAVHKLHAKKKIVATGTPILNRPQELFSILNFLDPKRWPKFYPYAFRYCAATRTRFGLDTSGASNLEELQRILRETVMIRRLKSEVLTELPEKRRELVLIDQDEELAALVERERDLLANIRDKELSRFSPEFSEMARVRHDQGVAKAKYVVSHIEDLLESIDKVVVMAWHTDVINILKEGLEKHNPVTVTGSTKLEDRQSNVDRFQTDPNCKVFIGNIQAAGVGLTLTAASWLCFAEGDWTPGKISQAEDRCIVKNSMVWCLKRDYLCGMTLTKIQDIKKGDFVLTHKGNIKKVTDTHTKEHQGLFTEIKYVGWEEPLKCTHDHKIYIKRDNNNEWIEAHKILPTDSMIFPKSKTNKPLDEVVFKDNWRIYKETKKSTCLSNGCTSNKLEGRGMCRKHYREYLKLPNRPAKPMQINPRYVRMPDKIKIDDRWLFLFGWFVAEGFSSLLPGKSKFISCSGHVEERQILEDIKDLLSEYGIKSTIYEKKESKGIELRAYSGELAFWFRDWFGHGAENKKIPDELINLPEDKLNVFFKGYINGDGYWRRNRSEWVTASKTLSYQLCHIAAKTGYIPTMRSISEKKRIINGKESLQKQHFIGSFQTDTKPLKNRLTDQDENYIYRPVRSVSTYYQQERVYDLTVEDDHSFVVGLATVHNCHRIGQKNTCNIQHLVVDGSIDCDMTETIIEKQNNIDKALDKSISIEAFDPIKEILLIEPDRKEATPETEFVYTQEEAKEWHSNLRRIAAMDGDRARNINGRGFNKIDGEIGHKLAELPTERLSIKQIKLVKKLANKYKGQLA